MRRSLRIASEGRKWLDKNAADAAASRKEDPQFFKDGGWDFERKYSIRSVVGDRYVSILRTTTWTPMARIPTRT